MRLWDFVRKSLSALFLVLLQKGIAKADWVFALSCDIRSFVGIAKIFPEKRFCCWLLEVLTKENSLLRAMFCVLEWLRNFILINKKEVTSFYCKTLESMMQEVNNFQTAKLSFLKVRPIKLIIQAYFLWLKILFEDPRKKKHWKKNKLPQRSQNSQKLSKKHGN